MTTRSTIPVQNITTCVICRQHFDDPRMLPCLHTYCFRCIQEGIRSNNGHFECPLRDGTKVDEKSIDSLPSNRIARDIVELLSPIQCSNCYVKTADHWCDKCGNDYCSNCSAIVHAPPALKNHRIVAIGDKCPEIASCDTHTDERLKYWCHACDTLVCRDCLLFEHKEHKSALMDQVAKQLKSQIDTSLSSIQTLLDGRVNQMKTLITRIDNAKTLNKTKVTEAMACLRRTIDEHERAVLNEISEIETGQKKQIEEYRIQLQGEQDNLDTQKSNFSIVLSVKDHTKLLQTKPEFVGYAERTNEVLNGLEPPNLINYHAEGLYQLQGLQEKVYQCGQLVQSSTYNNPKLEKQIADIKENALLQLNDQQLNDQDMEIIANALKKTNTTRIFTQLDMCRNQIGFIGAKHLADALSENHTLVSLNLYSNPLGDHGIQYLTDALRNNQSLTRLYLNSTQITDYGAYLLAIALKHNQTLTQLGLFKNAISHIGAQHLADALHENPALTSLNLNSNRIGNQGAQYIAKALRENQTLTKLYLENNQITEEGAKYLADALQNNRVLRAINVFYISHIYCCT